MNLATLILAGLRQRPLIQFLNLVGLSLGVALVVALLLAGAQLRGVASAEARGIDLVVGATGSPLQLVLASVYHVDGAPGNIAAEQWPRWRAHPLVARAVPIGLGDSIGGFRLVGTTSEYLDLLDLKLVEGAWSEGEGAVVLGATVAESLGLVPGDKVRATHGVAASSGPDFSEGATHDHPLRVAGILAPSGRAVDRLVLTPLRTVWELHGEGVRSAVEVRDQDSDHDHDHEHDDDHRHDGAPLTDTAGEASRYPPSVLEGQEVTAVLLQYASPLAAGRLSRAVNAESGLQAASPAVEMGRLVAVFGTVLRAAQGLALLVVMVAALGLFVALYQSLEQRRYDIALLRVLGASRARVSLLLLGEATVVALGACVLGLALGHAAVEVMARLAGGTATLPISGWRWVGSTWLVLPLGLLVALLAAALPAWRAYRMDVSGVLAHHV